MTHANQSPAQTNKTALRAGSSNVPVMGDGKAFDRGVWAMGLRLDDAMARVLTVIVVVVAYTATAMYAIYAPAPGALHPVAAPMGIRG